MDTNTNTNYKMKHVIFTKYAFLKLLSICNGYLLNFLTRGTAVVCISSDVFTLLNHYFTYIAVAQFVSVFRLKRLSYATVYCIFLYRIYFKPLAYKINGMSELT